MSEKQLLIGMFIVIAIGIIAYSVILWTILYNAIFRFGTGCGKRIPQKKYIRPYNPMPTYELPEFYKTKENKESHDN